MATVQAPSNSLSEVDEHVIDDVPTTKTTSRLDPEALEVPPPYSVFSIPHKWIIVTLAALAGMFSPLAANIYFPAIPTLAKDFGTSVQDINLTVTVYMVVQGITPTLWGAVADSHGRRPVYLISISLFVMACVGLALTPSSAYWLLMLLRCLSAAGSAVLIALGAGTVGDLSEPSERGKFMGAVTMGPMLGPCIGPVFGGLLNQHFGWRAIFWFLVILGVIVLVSFILFFPETLRSLVGNGSISATGMNVTVWDMIVRQRQGKDGTTRSNDTDKDKDKDTDKESLAAVKRDNNPLVALKYFLEKDVAIILVYNALAYTTFYGVTTTLSSIMEDNYGLSTSKTGLCYLPIGIGCLVGTYATGRFLDRDFRMTREGVERRRRLLQALQAHDHQGSDVKKQAVQDIQIRASEKWDPNDLLDFPLEHARLRSLPIYSLILFGSIVAYGWLVQYHVPLAAPLLVQFVIGYGIMAVMQVSQVILVDMFPGKGASVTANNNLCRCLLGAVGTAVVNPMMKAVGSGWTMMIFVGVSLMWTPLVILEWRMGMGWRRERTDRSKNNMPR